MSLFYQIKSAESIYKLIRIASREFKKKYPNEDFKFKRYRIYEIDDLKNDLINKLELKDSETLSEVKTLSGLKDMAKMLNISGYSKYSSRDKEVLRDIIRQKLEEDKMGNRGGKEEKKEEEKRDPTLKAEWGIASILTFINKRKGVFLSEGKFGKAFSFPEGICKIVDFSGDFGFESFKWEVAISIKASEIGVGPSVIEQGICYSYDNHPTFGYIITKRLQPAFHVNSDKIFEKVRTLHKGGILHRDLSLNNVMMSMGEYVIIDYGLSLLFEGEVPKELRLLDYGYLFKKLNRLPYLEDKLSGEDYKFILQTINDPNLTEPLIAKYFPLKMLKSIGPGQARLYLNRVEFITKEIQEADKLLFKRYSETE